jgi:hypothetical protein
LVRHIPKLDTPPKYFSSGNIAHNSSEPTKDCHHLNTSFLVRNGLFPPLMKTKNVLAPLVLSSLKILEDHLLRSREFAQTVGNISTIFWLAITQKDAVKEAL